MRWALGCGWFVAGAFVLFVARPFVVLAGTAAVTLVVLGWSGLPVSARERRHESDTLILLAPLFALYLAVASGWPGWSLPSVARVANVGATPDTAAILATLELLAAFTVLGYAVAEFRGRLELPFPRIAPLVMAVGGGVGLLLEVTASSRPSGELVALRAVIAALAAGYGGGIYHLQRTHIRALLGGTGRGRGA